MDFSTIYVSCSLRRSGFSLGRQEIREVANRRSKEIVQFLGSLFECADEVAHSDLVYTFFHPLLRDQEEANVHIRKLRLGEWVNKSGFVIPWFSPC